MSGTPSQEAGPMTMTAEWEARYRKPYTGVFETPGDITFGKQRLQAALWAEIDALRARLATLEAERDRQYARFLYDADQTAKQADAATEGAYREGLALGKGLCIRGSYVPASDPWLTAKSNPNAAPTPEGGA